MVLYHPTIEECLAKAPLALGRQFMRGERVVNIDDMLSHLPLDSGKDEIQRWYNVPYDSHPSNYGARIYAQAVERRVAPYIRGMLSTKP
jgi:hypothetical protein